MAGGGRTATCRAARVRAARSAAVQSGAFEAAAGVPEATRSVPAAKRLRWAAGEIDDVLLGAPCGWRRPDCDMPSCSRSGGEQRCRSDCCFRGCRGAALSRLKHGGDEAPSMDGGRNGRRLLFSSSRARQRLDLGHAESSAFGREAALRIGLLLLGLSSVPLGPPEAWRRRWGHTWSFRSV